MEILHLIAQDELDKHEADEACFCEPEHLMDVEEEGILKRFYKHHRIH